MADGQRKLGKPYNYVKAFLAINLKKQVISIVSKNLHLQTQTTLGRRAYKTIKFQQSINFSWDFFFLYRRVFYIGEKNMTSLPFWYLHLFYE